MATACPTTVASAQSNSELVPSTTPVPTLLQKANDQVQTLISQYGNAMALSCASLASTPAAAALSARRTFLRSPEQAAQISGMFVRITWRSGAWASG